MPQKRLRIFAGPNGSGKSELLRIIPETIPIGYYINADDIEKLIKSGKGVKLKDYGITPDNNSLYRFFERSDFVLKKSDVNELKKTFSIRNGLLSSIVTSIPPKYSAAIIAEFLREENLKAGNDFSFETVMSHKNKIAFIKRAKQARLSCLSLFYMHR